MSRGRKCHALSIRAVIYHKWPKVDDGAIEIRERQVHECSDPSTVGTNVFVVGKILTYREEKDAGAEIVVIASSSGSSSMRGKVPRDATRRRRGIELLTQYYL